MTDGAVAERSVRSERGAGRSGPPDSSSEAPAARSRLRPRQLLVRPEISALAILVLLVVASSLLSDRFLTLGNVTVVLQPMPELAIVAIGVTVLMIAGEFDLSVGSVFALSPMVNVLLMQAGTPMAAAIPVGLLVACLVGLVNAAITLRLRIPSFITTLGMLFMARSLTIVLAGGFPPVFPREAPVEWLVGRVELLRASVFYMLALAVLIGFALRRTDLGHWIYATGGHTQAARDMGIPTARVKTVCFVLCSLLAGFAGIVQSFRIKAIVPSMGEGLELQAIAAAVIGGAALMGGIGSVVGAIVGTLLTLAIENILILSRIDANWFKFAVGALIVLAVVLNTFTRERAEGRRGAS